LASVGAVGGIDEVGGLVAGVFEGLSQRSEGLTPAAEERLSREAEAKGGVVHRFALEVGDDAAPELPGKGANGVVQRLKGLPANEVGFGVPGEEEGAVGRFGRDEPGGAGRERGLDGPGLAARRRARAGGLGGSNFGFGAAAVVAAVAIDEVVVGDGGEPGLPAMGGRAAGGEGYLLLAIHLREGAPGADPDLGEDGVDLVLGDAEAPRDVGEEGAEGIAMRGESRAAAGDGDDGRGRRGPATRARATEGARRWCVCLHALTHIERNFQRECQPDRHSRLLAVTSSFC
jgi:hypothetical protein